MDLLRICCSQFVGLLKLTWNAAILTSFVERLVKYMFWALWWQPLFRMFGCYFKEALMNVGLGYSYGQHFGGEK